MTQVPASSTSQEVQESRHYYASGLQKCMYETFFAIFFGQEMQILNCSMVTATVKGVQGVCRL
jgi:hypothetical protein